MSSNRKTIQDAVYDELRSSILKLILKPGTAMSTQDMSVKLNVSRTPVREAFIRLQREGLVQARPQRETIVSKIDLDRVEQERFIRENMEMGVVEPFLQQCSKKDLNWIEDKIQEQKCLRDEGDTWHFLKSDDEMHQKLFQVANQGLAWSTVMNTNGHYIRLRLLTLQNKEIMDAAIRQHEEWLEVLRADDVEGVRKILANHVRKINYEKVELVQLYGDYFVDQEDEGDQLFEIGHLR